MGARATVRRFLLTLVREGYADTDGKYFGLRPKVLELGYAALSSLTFLDVVQPVMTRLAAELEESCFCAILDDEDCGDDLECIFDEVAGVLAISSAGATIGAWALGRAADTSPSFVGSALGSIVGAAAGLGVLKLLDEIDPDYDEGTGAIIGFSLTQGVFTAIGSRVGKAMRD